MRAVSLRLDIDGQSYFCKTYNNTGIQISRKITQMTIQDGLVQQSTLSQQTFRIALTDDLVDAIGDITDFTQDARINLNKEIKGSVYVDNIPRFYGSFQFIAAYKRPNTDFKEAELLFDGQEVSLKKSLEDLQLSDVLAGETIPYNKAEIENFIADPQAYRDNNGYYFPLVDYGQQFTADTNATTGTIIGNGQTPLTQLDFKPAVTYKKIFEKIAEVAGIDITYDSSLNDIVERQSVLLHNSESRICAVDTSPLEYTGYMDRSVSNTQTVLSNVIQKAVFDREYNYNVDQIDLPNDLYTAPLTGIYTFKVSGDYQLTNNALSNQNFNALFTVEPSIATRVTIGGIGSVFINSGQTRSFNANTTVSLELTAGETVFMGLSQGNSASFNLDFTLLSNFRFEIVSSPEININSNIDIAANCPDLTAWDIYRTIALQTFSITELTSEGVFNLIPWTVWVDNNSENVFLDDDVDPTRDIEIVPFSIGGAKTIELKYKEDEDIFNEVYRKNQAQTFGTLKIDDTGTDGTTNTLEVELPFASSPLSYIPNTSFPIIKLFDSEGKTIKGNPRLIYAYESFPIVNFAFDLQDAITGVGALSGYSGYYYTGHWEIAGGLIGGYSAKDYNFGQSLSFFRADGYPKNTLYERFWKQYINETYSENARQVTFSTRLPLQQIEELKLNERVYFGGARFRITELNNIPLTVDDTFQIRMMKRVTIENIDIAPLYDVDVIDGIVQWKRSIDNVDVGDGSGEPAADVEASAIAYGYFYDSSKNIANQRGIILQV